ncbi:adenosylcobinamide-phosphate synthase [Vibrio sp. 10N.286.49.B3]|uniref:cobalamin biosynthesis family protein n=1 Tax=Vibrio sp. 10N.286.49.B3 TaxID=1880855 RepID=UPI000C8568F8|nr:cobalamin biosynthesis family protein [Vibrio sp. 10N.286.49.B3]PMH39772.1 adenosylcobinamide-phosphate synthase [Vibrio sp. 10N.286.49.B3]
MSELFASLYANGALLVMWGALLIHLILPIPDSLHPMTLWRKFALLLSDKVNKNNAYSQSILSGSLALCLMILSAVVLLIALKTLAWQAQLFDLALLLIALDWRSSDSLCRQLSSAIQQDDKNKARQLLAATLNRETTTLSMLGLGKAGAETLIIGFSRRVIGVLFWYLIGGAIGALLYRMISELARTWSPSRRQFSPFGLPTIRLLAVMDFVPFRFFALMIIMGKQSQTLFSQMLAQQKSWPTPGPAWLLSGVGNKLSLSLGGPALYNSHKAIRAKVGGRIAPSALHLEQINALLISRAGLWIALQSLLFLALYQGV